MSGLIKNFQKRELDFLHVQYSDDMSFEDARELINRNTPAPKPRRTTAVVESVVWEEFTGVVTGTYPDIFVEGNDSKFFISNFEYKRDLIQVGSKVKCKVGFPSGHRGIAEAITVIEDTNV